MSTGGIMYPIGVSPTKHIQQLNKIQNYKYARVALQKCNSNCTKNINFEKRMAGYRKDIKWNIIPVYKYIHIIIHNYYISLLATQ